MVGSASKTQIAPDQAQLAVETAFGGTVSLARSTECEEGWFNAVHRLELSDGRTVVLRVAPPPGFRAMRYKHNLMDTEVAMLRLVRGNSEVPVPEVLFCDES